ncbi:hypothetical protein H5410_019323 [Solanum commersonii]|uniref:Uncharacterized protein n=1 Tax=Solanum commersonii TaxID=4109 RepID=A0A9J5Z5X2_SOLCO|nr:hypothetical protein H5410_019323 [Solanum commersonii]
MAHFQGKRAWEQSTGFIGDPKFRRHFHQKFTWSSVKTLVMNPVGHHGQNGLFSKSNNPWSRKPPILPIFVYETNWSPRPKLPIFKVKRALKYVNPLFCQFSCAIVRRIYW